MNQKQIKERKSEILNWISLNIPNIEIVRRLGCKVDTLKVFYKNENINYKGNQSGKGIKDSHRISAIEFIKSNASNSKKRIRLIEDGLKENKCECCGLSEWQNKPIPLELHHIDGNHYNNNLNNLQILCSNCHMLAHNYCNTK